MCAGPSSPLQIEINGNFTHVGQWLPVSPIAQCQSEHYDPHWENHTTCKMDRDTWTRKPGWVRNKPFCCHVLYLSYREIYIGLDSTRTSRMMLCQTRDSVLVRDLSIS